MVAATRLEELAAALLGALATYNVVHSELRTQVRGVETHWQKAWDRRSERWQKSTAGQSISEAITACGTLADDLEEIQIELPTIKIPETD